MSEDRRTRLKRWLESGDQLAASPTSRAELWESSPIPVADPSNHICTFIECVACLLPRIATPPSKE